MYKSICFCGLSLLLAAGCDNPAYDSDPDKVTTDGVRRDVDRAVDSASALTQQAAADFRKKLDARAVELDAEIAKLRERGAEISEETKADWEVKMAAVEEKRKLLGNRLEEMGDSSADAWAEMQASTQKAWDDLEAAIRDASDDE